MSKKETKKAINFDLDTKELLKHFNNTHQAYSSIKKFMEENVLDHIDKALVRTNEILNSMASK